MRKLNTILLLLLLALPFITFSQDTTQYVYCEIVGSEKMFSNKINIVVDFGQYMKVFADNRMKDESGKPRVFNSMIDALNFMGKQGWEFAQAYAVTLANDFSEYHYIMKKKFSDLSEADQKEFLKGYR